MCFHPLVGIGHSFVSFHLLQVFPWHLERGSLFVTMGDEVMILQNKHITSIIAVMQIKHWSGLLESQRRGGFPTGFATSFLTQYKLKQP